MWNVFKKVWVKGKGVKAVLSDACNIGHVDEGDVTNGERTLFPQRFPWRSSLRMRGSRQHEFRFWGTLTHHENKESSPWMPDQAGHDGQRCVTDSDTLSPSVSSRHPLLSETGRSMIEMLGVLAIIGVLSIAAVAGYRFALLKFRANEVTNELNMRAINVSAQMLNTGTVYEKNELIEDGFGDTLTVGFPVETAISDRNTDYFEILVSDIPADLCRQILRDYENPIMIFVNNVRYNADTTICDDETQNALNDMGFIYKNDLGTHEACSEKGYFDEEDFQCHCSGNTYLDIYTNDCLCPAGHVWSAGEGTCIESICPEGEFESLTAGCVPCSDETTYTIATDERHKQLCEASTCGRVLTANNKCSLKQVCPTDTFLTPGGCKPCNDPKIYIVSGVSNSSEIVQKFRESCETCHNRLFVYSASQYYCISNTTCPSGQFLSLGSFFSQPDSCLSCDDVGSYYVGSSAYTQGLCQACKNESGKTNRSVINQKCQKSLCDSGEFMGADGQCYACTHANQIKVNENSGCTDPACGRSVTQDGYCQRTNCPTGTHVFIDGNCYSCDSTFKATKEQCDQCTDPEKLWLGTYVDETTKGTCGKKCILGTSYPHQYGGFCYSCAGFGDGGGFSCDNEVCRQYCEACHNYLSGSYCFSQKSCNRGESLRSSQILNNNGNYLFCHDCTIVDSINIGTSSEHRDMCLACTTKPRFWVGSYCYRCDSHETPEVTTPEEEDSCYSCKGVREVKDGKCVLVQ